MRMRKQQLGTAVMALVALAFLPLASDGGVPESCNMATSLASQVAGPVAGDESFFTLPVGPANIMLLLDSSGSMDDLPQCFNGWGSGSCTPPAISVGDHQAEGTCDLSRSPGLDWMNDYTPTATYADPGHGRAYFDPPANTIALDDRPNWGAGCVGDNCLFDPTAYYGYGGWNETSAKRMTRCVPSDDYGPVIDIDTGQPVAFDEAACQACMAAKGYYFWSVKKIDRWYPAPWNVRSNNWSGAGVLLGGGWLNANPPKFVAARKVVKDLAWIDPNSASNVDRVRLGLTILGNLQSADAARIIVPLGPDASHSYPSDVRNMVPVRQMILDAANRKIAGLPSFVSGGTPMAGALFNVGQYMSTPGLWTANFGAGCSGQACERPLYAEGVSGLARAPWAQNNADQHSICWGCQQSSVIIITDGSPNGEMTFPPTIANYDSVTYQSPANCGAGGARCMTDGPSPLPRVSSYLHSRDVRTDLSVADPQTISTFTVSFGVTDPMGLGVLQATANMGGGTFNNTKDGRSLAAAVSKVVSEIVTRVNSFSAPSAASLSSIRTVAADAFLTRFKPNDTPMWEGHLFQGELFDEFANGCDATMAPGQQPQINCHGKMIDPNFNGDADANGKNVCTGVFLIDRDCDEIVEDPATGTFLKKSGGNGPANLVWDAGQQLSDPTEPGYAAASERSPKARHIKTWVPGTGAVSFVSSNAATLAPFMNLDPTWCAAHLTLWNVCGPPPLGSCTDVTVQCAEQIIHFVRGWDVTDNDGDGCGGPGRVTNAAKCPGGADGEERDRANDSRASKTFWKLGDIFHSSPVVVKPPISEFLCDSGYENQCVATIHSPTNLFTSATVQTPIAGGLAGCNTANADAYEGFRFANRDRQRVVLVGANDGMLHAFDAGAADTSKTRDVNCSVPSLPGTGKELWAFIPTDLLPRLKSLTEGHQYMVDGSTMVREVWVDGSGGGPLDGRKQKAEFHTVAILSERAGGTQYTALDVTDPTNPTYLWTFPPPCTADALEWMGQSWNDFSPRPPPVGPVKLAMSGGRPDPLGRGFEERWAVMINGGYDPTLTRGNAVWMLDAWTGATLWRYTNADFNAQGGWAAGRTNMYPVAASVAFTDIGDPARPSFDSDGFFDTATWGDLAGNLFVARFHDPGIVDPITGQVSNWFAARTFEQQRRRDDKQLADGRSEFYYMTSNAFDVSTHTLRTLLGSGNREQAMQQGAACTPDNVLGCVHAGCDTFASNHTAGDPYAMVTSFQSTAGQLTLQPVSRTSMANQAFTGAPGNQALHDATMRAVCPSGTVSGLGSYQGQLGHTYLDVPIGNMGVAAGRNLPVTCQKSRFYSVWAYGRDPAKQFHDLATAQAFERNRFTDVPLNGCAGTTGGSCSLIDTTLATVTTASADPTCGNAGRCSATADDAGWFYEYGDSCPTKTCGALGACTNEKTGSGSTVMMGCATWNGFKPVGSLTGNDPCTGSVGTPQTFGYVSNFISGIPDTQCGYVDPNGTIYRATARSAIAVPMAPNERISMNAKGEVAYTTLQIDPGNAPLSTSMGSRSEVAEPVYWLDVPRDLHLCRHDAALSPAACE